MRRFLLGLVVSMVLVVSSPVSAASILLKPSAPNVAPGATVDVSVDMVVGDIDITMTAINAIIFFDPAVFTYVDLSAHQGDFLTHDWVGLLFIPPPPFPAGVPSPGELRIAPLDWDGGELFLAGTGGTLFTFKLQAKADAPLGLSNLTWGNGSFLGDGFGYADETFTDRLLLPSSGTSINVDAASAPVPEPASMLLLGTGLVGLGAAWRKRRH